MKETKNFNKKIKLIIQNYINKHKLQYLRYENFQIWDSKIFKKFHQITKMSNSTFENSTFSIENCSIPQYVSSLSEFFQCYGYMMKLNLTRGILELSFVIATIIVNVFVFSMIYFNSVTWTVFDQLMLGHCFIQLATSIVDIPFYHIYVG